MGIKLPSFLYLMSCDVYYASYLDASSTPSQDLIQDDFGNIIGGVGQNEFGESVKIWGLDRNERQSYFNVMGTVNLQDLNADTAFTYKKRLNGRFKYPSDPRVDKDGGSHPISDILITNVCKKAKLLGAPDEELQLNADGTPIVFEVMSVDPFIDPWGNIEYYKILLERADDQGLLGGTQ